MAGVIYELRFKTAAGAPLFATQNVLSAEYTLVENDAGACSVLIPEIKPIEYFTRDTRLEIWRGADGGQLSLVGNTCYLLRKFRYERTSRGTFIRLGGDDLKALFNQRFINSPAGLSGSRKNMAIDDMMREIVRQNLSSAAGTDSSGVSRAFPITVEANTTRLAVVEKAFAWDNVLSTLKSLAQTSAELGTYVAFDIYYDALSNTMEFRLYPDQRGVNRRVSSFNLLALSTESGSLSEIAIDYDYTAEITACKAGGSGEGTERALGAYTDVARAGLTPFNYREDFYNNSNIETVSVLNRDAQSQVNLGRPMQTVRAKINQTSLVQYGRNYGWGDILTVNVKPSLTIGMRLSKVHVTLDNQTGEQIEGILESQSVIQ